jgi:regulation of enolase protein 1 (concanavalin A-like superfamily)
LRFVGHGLPGFEKERAIKMPGTNAPFGAAVIVGVAISLNGINSCARAEQPPEPPNHFVTAGEYHINLDQIGYVKREHRADGRLRVAVHFKGVNESALVLGGQEAVEFLAAAFRLVETDQAANRGVKLEAEAPGDAFAFLALDTFDGKLGLNWKPARPDPSHVSLTKTPGALTITTQRGGIFGEETKDEFGERISIKNLYLIDNPLAPGGDFVVTTCVSGFTPETSFQQAGLIVYNDDDNYLKFGYEYNWPNAGGGQAFCIVTETDAKGEFQYLDTEHSGLKRYWVRLTKHGKRYEYAFSTDGKSFTVSGEVVWGDGSPKQIGMLAKNGGNKDAGELDAAFEYFELRAPAPAPASPQPDSPGQKP